MSRESNLPPPPMAKEAYGRLVQSGPIRWGKSKEITQLQGWEIADHQVYLSVGVAYIPVDNIHNHPSLGVHSRSGCSIMSEAS